MFILWCWSLCGVSVLNWPLWWRTLKCLTFNLPDWTKAHSLFSFFPQISRCVSMKMTRHNWELTYTELQPTNVDGWFDNKVVKLYCDIVLLHSIAGTLGKNDLSLLGGSSKNSALLVKADIWGTFFGFHGLAEKHELGKIHAFLLTLLHRYYNILNLWPH